MIFIKFLNINKNKSQSPNNQINSPKVNLRKIIGVTIALVIIVTIIAYSFVQVKGFYDKTANSWDELVFSWQHPNLIQSLREDYQQKQKELEESFLKKEKSAEQKLLDEITEQLKQTKKE